MQNELVDGRIVELMRRGARRILDAGPEWRTQMQDAVAGAVDTDNDPATHTAIRQYNILSVTHWATSVAKEPDKPVAPFIDPEIRVSIREQIRLGTPENILNGYRAAQIAGWRAWMQVAFALTSEKDELEMLLEYSSQQIEAFSQSSIDLLSEMIDAERAEFARSSPDVQHEAALDILNDHLRDPKEASHRLGYRLDQSHQAIILWSSEPKTDADALDLVADQIDVEASGTGSLRIYAKSSTLWLWLSTPITAKKAALLANDRVQIALGRTQAGYMGFRESHETARIAQRMLVRRNGAVRSASFEEVQLAHLLVERPEFARFAKDALGRLLEASEDVRSSLRVYLSEGCNAASAAKALGLHRNTMNRHLERANDLLPEPLSARSRIAVGAALDGLAWS